MPEETQTPAAPQQRYVRYDHPVERAPVRIYNSLGDSLRRLGLPIGELGEEAMCAAARKQTGLCDFGDEAFREPLRLLIRSLETEAGLHAFGRVRARQLIVNGLANRLRLQHDWKRWPAILDQDVRQPLFILGLPRTGTTLLFKLLASDPAHRWLAFWEAHTPSPPPERLTYARDPRRRRAARQLRTLDYLLPNLAAIHEFDADGPEECYPLLANSFAGVQYSWGFNVPSYDRWLTTCDMEPTYRYYRQQLQLLQWRCRGERWVLKSPVHLYYIAELLAVFPDARVVQLHRDPLKVLPSACSLRATLRGLVTNEVDKRALATSLAEGAARDIERCMEVRQRLGADNFFDLYYSDLVSDPMEAVRSIYRRFGHDLSPEAETSITDCLARNPQNKHGVHSYSLEQFYLDPDTERRRFANYCSTFAVPQE